MAYHEAGHAVAAYFTGRRIKHVSTDGETTSVGHVALSSRKPISVDTPKGADQNDQDIMILMAGIVAVLIFQGRKGYITATDIMSHGAGEDWTRICSLAKRRVLLPYDGTGIDKENEAYLRWLEIRTRNLLTVAWAPYTHWPSCY